MKHSDDSRQQYDISYLGQTYDALFPLLVIALIYLALVLVLQYFIRKVERRLNSAY